MKNRNLIAEILAKKQRIGEPYTAASSFADIERSLAQINVQDSNQDPIFSLYLVGLAACVELSTRIAIRRFIDHGSPYIERVDNFDKQILRFNLDVTRALSDRRISFGEFISHLLPISSVEQINSHLKILLEQNLSVALANVREYEEPKIVLNNRDEYIKDNTNTNSPPILISDINQLMRELSDLFAVRHVVAHEANFYVVSYGELKKYFNSVSTFITALEELVDQTLHPGMPRSAFGISHVAIKEAEEATQSMNEALRKLISLLIKDTERDKNIREKFQKTQNIFMKYVELEKDFEMTRIGRVSGNTMRLVYYSLETRFYKERAERINEIIDRMSGLTTTL